VSWTPWSRLNLQTGFNYVWSKTRTPTSDYTRATLDAQNNYWTVNFSSSVVLDDKSDLNLSYFYYRADNYEDNSAFGVPLGSGAEEHGVTATLIRRISKNLRLSLNYGYFHYTDDLFGGNRDYYAHLVHSSLRFRF
jgi:outer membrane protein assembly factor BamA